MSFEWTSYLSLAKKLNEGHGEEYKRSAMSRAYYCAYHSAKLHLESACRMVPKRNPHASLIELLSSRFDTVGTMLARELARLWDYRNQADYDPEFSYDSKWIDLMISRAEQFVKEVKKLSIEN